MFLRRIYIRGDIIYKEKCIAPRVDIEIVARSALRKGLNAHHFGPVRPPRRAVDNETFTPAQHIIQRENVFSQAVQIVCSVLRDVPRVQFDDIIMLEIVEYFAEKQSHTDITTGSTTLSRANNACCVCPLHLEDCRIVVLTKCSDIRALGEHACVLCTTV